MTLTFAPWRLAIGSEERPHVLGERVAVPLALVLREEVDLEVGDEGAGPQEVVPHEAVEVERGGGPDVDLDVGDLGELPHLERQVPRDGVRRLERRPLGHVDDDLDLALVVVREHLDLGDLEIDEGHRQEEEDDDPADEGPALRRALKERREELLVEAVELVLLLRLGVPFEAGLAGVLLGVLAEELERQPRGDDEGDEEGEDHRRRGVDRDRPHVRAHEARDEGEREERADDGERGEDRRVPDLVDGVDRRQPRRAPAELVVPVDVLDDDDRVVDEDADREDEREERDTVQRVAEEERRARA